MKDQMAVANQVHRAVADHIFHVLAQLLAALKCMPQPGHAIGFFGGERVRIAGIDRGQVRVAQRIAHSVHVDLAGVVVDMLEQPTMIERPVRIAGDQSVLQA